MKCLDFDGAAKGRGRSAPTTSPFARSPGDLRVLGGADRDDRSRLEENGDGDGPRELLAG